MWFVHSDLAVSNSRIALVVSKTARHGALRVPPPHGSTVTATVVAGATVGIGCRVIALEEPVGRLDAVERQPRRGHIRYITGVADVACHEECERDFALRIR